jgi:plasmid stabilization system protein ParE
MKQIWLKSARTRIERQERWFIDNKGQDFAVTFIENIRKAVNGVMAMPSIGQLGYATNGYTYRSVLTIIPPSAHEPLSFSARVLVFVVAVSFFRFILHRFILRKCRKVFSNL